MRLPWWKLVENEQTTNINMRNFHSNKLFDPSSYEFTISNDEQQKHLPSVRDVWILKLLVEGDRFV